MKSPVVIGALGGSGTRVVARIVRESGYFLGNNRNESEDAMEFVEFYDRWINRYMLRERAPFCREEDELMQRDFNSCMGRHRAGIPQDEAPWGWKEPRSIYLLPFFHAIFSDLKFIHVVRDGKDMAFSSNQNQLRKHGAALLDPSLRAAPQPVQMAALWAKINLSVAAYAESHLVGRYLIVQFEELCVKRREIATELATFLDCPTLDVGASTAKIITPPSMERWRQVEDKSLIAAIHAQAGETLRKFGYS